MIIFHRLDQWQMGYIFFDKDHYRSLRAAGVGALRRAIVGRQASLSPPFARRHGNWCPRGWSAGGRRQPSDLPAFNRAMIALFSRSLVAVGR
jgi:hypothetical protein